MKKIFAAALILALFLSGCGFTEQLETVKEEYIDPAIERAQSGEAVAIENTAVAAPNVNTNRERLTDYVPFEAVYTRADGALIEKLEPSSNYGRLLPFAGGLVTESGEIVLDPVCTAVTTAAYQTQTDTVYLDIYILENAEGMYAACGADGAWTTGFDYTAVLPMELGVLCIEDEQGQSRRLLRRGRQRGVRHRELRRADEPAGRQHLEPRPVRGRADEHRLCERPEGLHLRGRHGAKPRLGARELLRRRAALLRRARGGQDQRRLGIHRHERRIFDRPGL